VPHGSVRREGRHDGVSGRIRRGRVGEHEYPALCRCRLEDRWIFVAGKPLQTPGFTEIRARQSRPFLVAVPRFAIGSFLLFVTFFPTPGRCQACRRLAVPIAGESNLHGGTVGIEAPENQLSQ